MEQSKNALWCEIQRRSKLVEAEMNPLQRKRTGSYYTGLDLTDVMMHELVTHLTKQSKKIYEYRFLEPCVGTGNFVFSYLKCVSELNLSRNEYIELLNNLYVADVNQDALLEYKALLADFAETYWHISLESGYFVTHIGTGLLIDITSEKLEYIPIEKVFPQAAFEGKFDIVVTNPPYKNLKAEKSHYETSDEYYRDKERYRTVSEVISSHFRYSADGVLNLYKLFLEEIIDQYANEGAYISLLVPTSILSDKTCYRLRTHILNDECLLSVKMIGEDSKYIDARQALCALLLKKGSSTSNVEICKDFTHRPDLVACISIQDILNEGNGNAIIAVDEKEYETLKKLRSFPTIKDLPFIVNLRGELDLTSNKDFIVSDNTGYPLLRGRNIGYYSLLACREHDFVSAEFVDLSKKKRYILNDRIICQQIANMHRERRVTFAFAPKNSVLGNSCNFIVVEPNQFGINIYTLLGLLNTRIVNWFFKLTSSNNHINNYEIDCFPIPVNSSKLAQISDLSRLYLETHDGKILEEIELCARTAYGI